MTDRWNDLRTHLSTRFEAKTLHDGRLGLVWRFPDARADQHQYVEAVAAFAEPHVAITCDVGTSTTMSSFDALHLNATLPIGALCFVGGKFVLRMLLPLEDTSPEVVERTLQRVAYTALRLRTTSRPQPVPGLYYE
jgi:hypothetical protein